MKMDLGKLVAEELSADGTETARTLTPWTSVKKLA
jgi:hypothetical protein